MKKLIIIAMMLVIAGSAGAEDQVLHLKRCVSGCDYDQPKSMIHTLWIYRYQPFHVMNLERLGGFTSGQGSHLALGLVGLTMEDTLSLLGVTDTSQIVACSVNVQFGGSSRWSTSDSTIYASRFLKPYYGFLMDSVNWWTGAGPDSTYGWPFLEGWCGSPYDSFNTDGDGCAACADGCGDISSDYRTSRFIGQFTSGRWSIDITDMAKMWYLYDDVRYQGMALSINTTNKWAHIKMYSDYQTTSNYWPYIIVVYDTEGPAPGPDPGNIDGVKLEGVKLGLTE